MRDYLLLYINGQRCRVEAGDCFLSLTDYLRDRLGLLGTKVVCREGDCGSCTVLVGRVCGRSFCYRPVDACIHFMHQLDGAHVVSVEGLGQNGRLTPIQEAMVRCHGSQCGYCTPGFTVAMTGLWENRGRLREEDLRSGLTGNLCRCTGYAPIIEAGLAVDSESLRRMNEVYRAEPMLQDLAGVSDEAFAIESGKRHVFGPVSIADVVALLGQYPKSTVVAGATDLGVRINLGQVAPDSVIDLNRVGELTGVHFTNEGDDSQRVMVCGARATWTEIESVCREACPQFEKILSVFGSPPIRHVGTIGGNIINASPIADSLPLLIAMDAELELVSCDGTRRVNINDFYLGYKQLDIRPGELLKQVHLPLPREEQSLRLFKVSRRRDLDIATFTAAIAISCRQGRIEEARLAMGAVGPTVVRVRNTEAFLHGRDFDETTMRLAGDVVADEITPISDVRGSAEFRYQLARNVLLKYYHERMAEMAVSP